MAEAVFSHLAQKENKSFDVRSAGFQSKLEDLPYHPLASEVCESKGIKLLGQSKVFTRENLAQADLVFALDEGNLRSLFQLDPTEEYLDKVYYLKEFSTFPAKEFSVPDPIGKTKDAFESSFRIIFDCCENLIHKLGSDLPQPKALALSERKNSSTSGAHDEEQWIKKMLPYLSGKSCLMLGNPSTQVLEILSKTIQNSVWAKTLPGENDSYPNIDTRILRTSKISTLERQFHCIIAFDSLDSIFPERLGSYLSSLSDLLKDDGVLLMYSGSKESCREWMILLKSFFPYLRFPEGGPIPFFPFFLRNFSKKSLFPLFAGRTKTSLNELIQAYKASHTGIQS